jgi:lipoyl-dependent peroxiredoxin
MSYTATATTIAGRNGHVQSSDEVVKFDLSMPKELGGAGKPHATNPEQLFAAGYSACFGSAVEAVSRMEHVNIDEISITAAVTLHAENHNYHLSVKLTAKLAGLDRNTAERIVHKAHEVCPYSKAVRNNVPVELVIG